MSSPYRLIFIILGFTSILAIGVIGYSILEDWSFFDSLYMTMITLTTTGFQEVHPLGHQGRIFTIILLIFGMGLMAYIATSTFNFFFNVDWKKRRRLKLENQIATLKDHTVIVGHGRMGKIVTDELIIRNINFVVIEKEESKIKYLAEKNIKFILGDATIDETLEKVNIKECKNVLCMIDDDADALYFTLAARSLNQNCKIISRASDELAKQRILRAGANDVLMPLIMSATRLASMLFNSHLDGFFDLCNIGDDSAKDLKYFDYQINEDHIFYQKPFIELKNNSAELIPVAIKTMTGDFIFNPKDDFILNGQDQIIFLGKENDFLEFIK